MKTPASIALAIATGLCAISQASESGQVFVSIKPIHSLVAGVMEGAGVPKLIVSGSSSPHDFLLKPSQVRDLQGAQAIFYVDDEFEVFLSNHVFKSLDKGVRRIPVTGADGLVIHALREGGVWEGHSHSGDSDDDDHHGHGHNHDDHNDHDDHDDHGDKTRAEKDLHIWLDPANARQIVLFAAQALSEMNPDTESLYRSNAQKLVAKLEALDERLERDLSEASGKPYVVFHDAYQYFERRYRLTSVGSIKLEHASETSALRLQQIRSKIRESSAKCVFREPQFPSRAVDTAIENTGAKEGILDPLGAELPEGPEQYFDLLSNLASDLKDCLL